MGNFLKALLFIGIGGLAAISGVATAGVFLCWIGFAYMYEAITTRDDK